MICSLKNKDGYCYAFAEWYVLDANLHFDNLGTVLYVNELWIHEDFRKKKTQKNLIKLIDTHPLSYTARLVYWTNLKHGERKTKLLQRSRLSKLGDSHGI